MQKHDDDFLINYSLAEQTFHKAALSNNFLKTVCFDFEKSVFSLNKNISELEHLFIAGLARSGTTALLNALYATDTFASLTYRDMPFLLCPNLWKALVRPKRQLNLQLRAHGDGIYVNDQSPEAFEEVFWNLKMDESHRIKNFRTYVGLICRSYKKTRYLSKNNQNVNRIDKILEAFPNSSVLVTLRDPLQHANSLLKQHRKFSEIQAEHKFIRTYMSLIGHKEFGLDYVPNMPSGESEIQYFTLDHWLKQWLDTYTKLLVDFEKEGRVTFIKYENICNNPYDYSVLRRHLAVPSPKENFKLSTQAIDDIYDDKLYSVCVDLYRHIT